MFGQGLWAPYPGYWWWSPHTIRSGKLTSQPEKTLTFGVTVPQISSPRLVPRPHYSARPMHFADTQEKCIDREGLGTRRTETKQKQKPIPAWENSRYYSIAATTGICIRNSMICSDILHKYHEWYFELNSKQNRLLWLNRQVNRKLIWEAMKLREWTKINFLKS